MSTEPQPSTFRRLIRWDAQLMAEDAAQRGWTIAEFARNADVADMTVLRFLRGERQTPATAKKLAKALRRSISRYLVSQRRVA